MIAPCAEGYTTYDLMSHQICLKYFPVPVSYYSARLLCQAEGGDLIKIDSVKKFNIFNSYHGTCSLGNNIYQGKVMLYFFYLVVKIFILIKESSMFTLCQFFVKRIKCRWIDSWWLIPVRRIRLLFIKICHVSLKESKYAKQSKFVSILLY